MQTQADTKNILIVDDEADVRTYLGRLLAEHGFNCKTAGDGEQAMACVRAEKPGLITLDMSMPNKSGVRFYSELKNDPDLASIPVIVVTGITGQGGPGDAEKFLSTRSQFPPPEAFIAKPVDPEELTAAIRKLL
jgi:CheY-like chemotaxis protein